MGPTLIFRAECGANTFGLIALAKGRATARTGRALLKNVLLGHAMLWLRRQSPDASQAVRYSLAGWLMEEGAVKLVDRTDAAKSAGSSVHFREP